MPALQHRPAADENRSVLVYWVCFVLALNVGGWNSGITTASTNFFLKDGLGLGPVELARFAALVGVPAYFGFAFGFLRDRWSPLGQGDRGYLLLFAPISALGFLSLAFGELGYGRVLLTAILLLSTIRLSGIGIGSFMAVVGQRLHLTGRINSAGTLASNLLSVLTLAAGGWIAAHLPFRTLMVGMAAYSLLLALFGLWKPESVYRVPRPTVPKESQGLREVGRLLRHRPLWPVLGISLLGSVTLPGSAATFVHLTDDLHASKELIGLNGSVFTACAAAGALLYAFLCRRFPVRGILAVLMTVAITQCLPLLYAPTAVWAVGGLGWYALISGVFSVGLADMQFRACPKGLEGAALGLFATVMTLSDALTNGWGAILYKQGGFAFSCWLEGGVNFAVVPLLFLVPRAVVGYEDASVAS
ncbi:hypothetical protein BH11ARM2_BH11ARM2_11020 [soil metagenome]